MVFAIRDDDTSFFTKPEELQNAYDFIEEGPISLSVVPFTVPHHEKGVLPYGEGIPFGYYPVGENIELVSYLKHNNFDIMLHGHTHEYKKKGEQWFPEMVWKEEEQIYEEMRKGKSYLENVFERSVRVFVAPNNAVDQKTIRSVESLSMNYSGIISHHDRDFSLQYMYNYLRRWSFRVLTGLRIPDVLDYGKHQEMVSYPLDYLDKLMKEYEICKKRNTPFSIYTHYWHINKDPETKKLLKDIVNYVMGDGAKLVALSSCFK